MTVKIRKVIEMKKPVVRIKYAFKILGQM
jgi:hypothetical protein